MAVHAEEFSVKPEVLLLEQLLAEVASGRLRVPRFQRPYVWRPDQMLDLYDSIERGYPIGSILVWETRMALPSLDQVAGIDIPPAPEGATAYLLDGHQRLSTLFGTLARRPEQAGNGSRDRRWWVYRVLGAADQRDPRFQHWGKGAAPANLLPMQAVLRTMDFLAYARQLARDPSTAEDCDALVDEAEQLAQRIKSYKIPVVRLIGGDLEHAVEAFSRVNSGGQQIAPYQMVSALAYRRRSRTETLTDRISAIRESIGDSGFGDIPPEPVFQTILAVAGEDDVQGARWAALADRVSGATLDRAVRQAEDRAAPGGGIPPLRGRGATRLAGAVPPAAHAARGLLPRRAEPGRCADPCAGPLVLEHLVVDRLRRRQRIPDPADAAPDAGLRRRSGRAEPPGSVRPTDCRTGSTPRTAGCAPSCSGNWAGIARRRGLDGKYFDPVELLARSGSAAYRRVVTGVPGASGIANRIVLSTPPGIPVRQAMLDLQPKELVAVVGSHAIPAGALTHLHADDGEGFIRERAVTLARQEQEFMQEMGVDPVRDWGREGELPLI